MLGCSVASSAAAEEAVAVAVESTAAAVAAVAVVTAWRPSVVFAAQGYNESEGRMQHWRWLWHW